VDKFGIDNKLMNSIFHSFIYSFYNEHIYFYFIKNKEDVYDNIIYVTEFRETYWYWYVID